MFRKAAMISRKCHGRGQVVFFARNVDVGKLSNHWRTKPDFFSGIE